jgi:hypothetical protein
MAWVDSPGMKGRLGLVTLPLNLVFTMLLDVPLAFDEEPGWRGYFLPQLSGIGRRQALLLSGCAFFPVRGLRCGLHHCRSFFRPAGRKNDHRRVRNPSLA